MSLNESDRKVVRSEREARALRIENKRRNNKGLELINTIDQLNESENTEVREDENLNILLHEAGNILTDLIIFPKRISPQTTQSKLILQNDAI